MHLCFVINLSERHTYRTNHKVHFHLNSLFMEQCHVTNIFLKAYTIKLVLSARADVFNIFSLSCWRENQFENFAYFYVNTTNSKHLYWKPHQNFCPTSWLFYWLIFFSVHLSLVGRKHVYFSITARFQGNFYSNRGHPVCSNKHYEEGFREDFYN